MFEGGVGLVWAGDGRIIFSVYDTQGAPDPNSNLWGIGADPRTGNPSGKANKITDWDGVLAGEPTVSRDANRLTVAKVHIRHDVYVGELKDRGTRLVPPTRLTVSESYDMPTGWMRDNKTILFSSDRLGRRQVFKQQMEQDTAEPLIKGPDDQEGAELSPDSRWILYWSSTQGGDSAATARLMRIPALGGSPEQVLQARMNDTDFRCPVGPDGPCVLSHWEQGVLNFYALDPMRGRGKEFAKTKLGPPADVSWSVSPDGSRIAIASRAELPEQVRILDLRRGTERNLALPHGWLVYSLTWTADGKALFCGCADHKLFHCPD